jgi:hypothetical protein
MPVTREELCGLEFDWFAVDSKGLLALCSSAGYGEIPAQVLRACTAEDQPERHIPELIARLPEIGSYATEGQGPGSCEEWKQLGRRGWFVYDWQHWEGSYRRIVVPAVVLRADDVPGELWTAIHPIRMAEVSFAASESLRVDA